jgi:hypothetical protein
MLILVPIYRVLAVVFALLALGCGLLAKRVGIHTRTGADQQLFSLVLLGLAGIALGFSTWH